MHDISRDISEEGEAADRFLLAVARRIERLIPSSVRPGLSYALVMLAAAYAATFLACATARLTFGFELSWLESGMQAMTDRLTAHTSIYVEPSPGYVPFIYPPFYYVVAHGIELLLPSLGSFVAMRLVSFIATLATAATLFATLGGHARMSARLRVLLALLPFAFYGRFEHWFDTSRVDALFVFLLFAATALLLEGGGTVTALGAGALGGLAALTKQPAVPLLLAAGAVCMLTRLDRGRTLLALATAVGSATVGLAALGELRNPWLYYYTLRVPATHPILPFRLVASAAFLVAVMPLFVLGAGCSIRSASALARAAPTARRERAWALLFAVWTAILCLLRLKQGASANFFLPLVPVGILAIASPLRRLGRHGEPLLLVQFLLLAYNPLAALPTAADWRAGFEFLDLLKSIPGQVFLPQFPAYLSMVGKPPVAHGIAVCDLGVLRPDLLATIRAQVEDGRYAAAFPWTADPGDDANAQLCRPRRFGLSGHPSRFVPFATVRDGASAFSAEQRSALAGIYWFDSVAAAAAANR